MIAVGMSTSCTLPSPPEQGFRLAAEVGFDGMEIMVTGDAASRDASGLRSASRRFGLPILAIHAPVLLLTSFVWGRDPQVKLERSAQLAVDVGAPTVVVHPPFRWQAGYAVNFERIVRETAERYDVEVAVENMFPWGLRGRSVTAYAPSPDPTVLDVAAMTLDFSHASLTGRDSLELALAMGPRLRHLHLCDGSGSMAEGKVIDEHLAPGRGTEPVAQVLRHLADTGWSGSITAEVNTRRARTEQGRVELLAETLAFARGHLAPRPGATAVS
ncbi:sugar phosphate isomerase/epimerase [Leifsonia sp. H3M29-4]|uniref:sugar phosphate isomerase/epimerase family protein n=1 Tax=Salinibacterium metalliresistens TaxID=3031321 RepID=UPI0023DBD3A7|nr:sugar phosphate isomerase/epimerase [Salinibacterium metalliresistens]MDF1479237.1 sugar phosphate isomerase/epimerase [Salinibacterium metalliresistens]